MEAIPHLRDENCIRSLTDLGAMGIGGACGEMGEKTGVRINLNKVPLKDASLTAWEILVSESQERMLLVIPPEKLRKAKRILRIYGVEYAAIGKFTHSTSSGQAKKFEAFWRSKKVVDIDMNFLWGACPIEDLPVQKPEDLWGLTPQWHGVGLNPTNTTSPIRHIRPMGFIDLKHLAKETLGSYNVSSKREALTRFDKTVQGRTVIEPLGGKDGKMPTHISVVVPTRSQRGIITTVSYNPQWAHLDPQIYVRMIFHEAVSRAVLGGADPSNIFLCSNFYTPKPTPGINWHLREMVKETLAPLTEEFGMPIITGKDSSSGTYITESGEPFDSTQGKRIDVPPTFVLGTVGIVPNVRNVVTQDFKKPGSKIVLVGAHGKGERLKAFFKKLHSLYQQGDNPILSASVIGEGGLIRNLFEMCWGGDMGMEINMTAFGSRRIENALFGDFIGSLVFEISPNAKPEEIFFPLPWRIIGRTQEKPKIKIFMTDEKNTNWLQWQINELAEDYETTFSSSLRQGYGGQGS